MQGPGPGLLGDGAVGQMAVAAHHLVAGRGEVTGQGRSHQPGQLVVLGPVAPRPVDARALLHQVALHPGHPQQVTGPEPGVLGQEMTGHVVRDLVGHAAVVAAGELRTQGELVGGVAVALHQILGRVVGVRGHQLGLGARDVEGIVPLDHIGACRLGHHDVAPGPHLGRQRPHVAPGGLVELLDVARVQPRGAAALGPRRQRAPDPVVLVDPHDVLAHVGVHVLHEAGGEHRDRSVTGRRGGVRLLLLAIRPPGEPGGEALLGVGRQEPLRRQADGLLHHPAGPAPRRARGPVHHRRPDHRRLAQRVRPSEELIGQALLERHTLLLAHRVHPAHEAREVELPLVRRDIRGTSRSRACTGSTRRRPGPARRRSGPRRRRPWRR